MPGGRLVTREFHPGFHASPFCDGPASIPPDIFHRLDLARHGALCAPAPASVALWPDGTRILGRGEGDMAGTLLAEARDCRAAVLARAAAAAQAVPPRYHLFNRMRPQPWPGQAWALRSLVELAAQRCGDPRLTGHLVTAALGGRTADPFLAGSALHLLAANDGGTVAGGLGRLGMVLAARAAEAGAILRCGVEVSEVRRGKHGVCALALADGTEIETRSILSTLDLKQTLLSFFTWSDLPADLVARAGQYRMGGGTARVLIALDTSPDLPPFARLSPLQVMPDIEALARAAAACRSGVLAADLPATLRLVSAVDPGMAPQGKAVLTATLAGVPYRLFDGGWTHDKREDLRKRVLTLADSVLPGLANRVIATQVIVPPDMEEALGATGGDLWGGEIAADQMLAFRPAQRMSVPGLYLAGGSTAAGVGAGCASGVYAAEAILADLRAGRLK